MSKKFVKCGICNKVIPQNETNKWVYHISFPRGGVACRHHHGIMDEWSKLFEDADKEFSEEVN